MAWKKVKNYRGLSIAALYGIIPQQRFVQIFLTLKTGKYLGHGA
jgi:hypothetical protein